MGSSYCRFVSFLWLMGAVKIQAMVPTKADPNKCPTSKSQEAILTEVLTAGMPQSLQDFLASTSKPSGKIKQRIQVSPGVHVFVGHGYANCVVLEAPRGLIVVDTLIDSDLANPVINQIREEISTDPFKALIYTNTRPDHVGGAKAFVNSQPGQHIDVWSFRDSSNSFWERRTLMKPAATLRKYRENGVDIPNGMDHNVSDYVHTGAPKGLLQVPPNHTIGTKKIRADIAGFILNFFSLPGPTKNDIGVYFPGKKILIIGDSFTNYLPNIYSISGEEPLTNIRRWISTLKTMLTMNIEILICAHLPHISGKVEIKNRIQQYVDALKYMHDQTMRHINRGFHPQVIANTVKLPKSLRESPDLREFKGTMEWSIRGIYQSTFGWFNGFAEDLFPLTPEEQARKWLDLVPKKRLLNSAKSAVKRGSLKDLKWAVQATSVLNFAKGVMSEDLLESLLKTRRRAFIKLAELQSSQSARNYLLRYVLEESCIVNNTSPEFSDTEAILYLPLPRLIEKLCAMVKAEEVEGVNKTVLLVFTDTKKSFNLRLQNAVLDIDMGRIRDFDLKMEMNSTNFRKALLGRISLEDAGAVIWPNITSGYEFLGYFDDASVSFFE